MKIVYVEIVSGEDSANNIALHTENPTDKEPIPCYNEEEDIMPIITRRIIEIEVDDNGIVQKFLEEGFEPQTQTGLRIPTSETDEAVIGKPFPF